MRRRRVVIGGLAIVILLAMASVVAWRLIRSSSTEHSASTQVDTSSISLQQDLIRQAGSPADKAAAYNGLAGTYEANGQYRQAVQARLKASKLDKGAARQADPKLADDYCHLGDQGRCARYLKATISDLRSAKATNHAFLPYYQRRLKAVEQGNLKDEPSFSEGLEP